MQISLEVLYQDEHCIVINKPAGMLVPRSLLAKHETLFVMQTLRDQIGKHVFPVHRLDRPTSGVLLFAFDSESAKMLTQQFDANIKGKMVKKTYVAVVRGWMDGDNLTQGKIDYSLSVIYDKIADKQAQTNKTQQHAVTDWQVLATTEQAFQARVRYPTSRYSMLKLVPHTGRKHQLRRHMKHVFHPIIGDTSYGDHYQNRAIRQHVGVNRLMLHAQSLTFTNVAHEIITVTAPMDEAWHKLMNAFSWQLPDTESS